MVTNSRMAIITIPTMKNRCAIGCARWEAGHFRSQPDNRRYTRWHVNFRIAVATTLGIALTEHKSSRRIVKRVVSECIGSMLHAPMYATRSCSGKFASLNQREIGTAISKQSVRYTLKPRVGMTLTCSKRNSFLFRSLSYFRLGTQFGDPSLQSLSRRFCSRLISGRQPCKPGSGNIW